MLDLKAKFREKYPIESLSVAIVQLYNGYKEDTADKIMWSIFMLDHPDKSKNPKAEIPYNERLLDIKTSYYDIDLENQLVIDARECFLQHFSSLELKLYAIQRRKLEELTMHFNTLNMDNKDQRDEYISISKILPAIWNHFDKVKKDYLDSIIKNTNPEIEGKGRLSKAEERRLQKNV